jgi:hypothetical protein
MLQDLNHEFCSRFVDELLLKDKNAKVIGSPLISTNTWCLYWRGQYTLGRIYILLQMIIEEAIKSTIINNMDYSSTDIEEILS